MSNSGRTSHALNPKETFNTPTGTILNDNDSGVDYLDHSIYAEALAKTIENVSTPITIGILGSWGSGKSFLLKLIKHMLLQSKGKDASTEELTASSSWGFGCVCRFVSMIMLLLLLIFSISILFLIMSTSDIVKNYNDTLTYTFVTISHFQQSCINASDYAVKFFVLCLLLFAIYTIWTNKLIRSFTNKFRLVLFVAFTKLPIKNAGYSKLQDLNKTYLDVMVNAKSQQQRQVKNSFIFVDFNAWEYAGSDNLWAGIVTNLSNAIEKEFHILPSRLFHMFNVEAIAADSILENTTLFVHFPCSNDKNKSFVKDIMRRYGMLRFCITYKEWLANDRDGLSGNKASTDKDTQFEKWWVVDFYNSVEADEAYHHLHLGGIEVSYSGPNNSISTKADKNSNELKPKCFINELRKNPRTTLSYLFLFMWIISLITIIAVAISTIGNITSESIKDFIKVVSSLPIIIQTISLFPVFTAMFWVVKKLFNVMYPSQKDRIMSALEGTSSSMAAQLGFMHKVKTEVDCITTLIKCAEYIDNVQYKVVISIDDLDRLPLSKVKSVFEAISILLSDPSSPFVCLIAVDPRIAIKSIEDKMSSDLLSSGVSGHEYLKKIINLPFCLPEIPNETNKSYLIGLFDVSDATKSGKKQTKTTSLSNVKTSKPNVLVDCKIPHQDDFLSACRKHLLKKDAIIHKYLSRNPRDIKRIYNILTLTSWTIYCYDNNEEIRKFLDKQKRSVDASNAQTSVKIGGVLSVSSILKFARNLLHWVVLTDQWPQTINLILEAIEENRRKSLLENNEELMIKKDTHLFDIYKKYVLTSTSADHQSGSNEPNTISPDTNSDEVYCYLSDLKGDAFEINKEMIERFKPFTVNFHRNLQQSVSIENSSDKS